jgi:hypothetical protein
MCYVEILMSLKMIALWTGTATLCLFFECDEASKTAHIGPDFSLFGRKSLFLSALTPFSYPSRG